MKEKKKISVAFLFLRYTSFFVFFFYMSPHEMKEEIEAKHFEHTFAVLGINRAAEPCLTKTGRGVCVSPQPLSHGVFSCDECYVSISLTIFFGCVSTTKTAILFLFSLSWLCFSRYQLDDLKQRGSLDYTYVVQQTQKSFLVVVVVFYLHFLRSVR